MSNKYNKGEWSELYAFLYSLTNGVIYGADEDLNKDKNIKYNVVSAFQSDIEYMRNLEKEIVEFIINGESYFVTIEDLKNNTERLFYQIKDGRGSTFEIPDIESLIEKLGIRTLKAGNRLKGDLVLKIHDPMIASEPVLSFSVKSHIGSKPTLVNSSKGTNFLFKIASASGSEELSNEVVGEINGITGSGKIKKRISEIYDKGNTLELKEVSSAVFSRNLKMIDFKMPEILAALCLESYFVKGKRIPDVVDSYAANNSLEDKGLIEYKVKQFLIACALGMVPLTPWEGLEEANGGYLVVKDDADVLCYHIYNRNKLSQYLYTHTTFDTPSTSRYSVGKILNDQITGERNFRLNLQIRFS
ncbi:HpaII family restriction endonuclease [Tetragenococcus halophilus]|uniref:HpaII family restriction endonuclease n=1 Tax=Tetragenococcus halophilus TaxID=51669 RepID=UPI00083DD1E4|nr:HpaII family restriction endonuclease [Tetragenococcus halophilus]MCO8292234.1 HpaII family restriction endonuclease [Tetragenococcus halophilus]